jgi:hypothetical protein
MTLFQKIALSLLGKEIEELLVRLQPRERVMSIFCNTGLSDNLLNSTNRFMENVSLIGQTAPESDASLMRSLSQLFLEFQREMDDTRSRHATRPVDYITKLRLLCDTINSECRAGFVNDKEFNDWDPLCIFQYNMISYIISTLMTGTFNADNLSDRKIQLIRHEFERIQDLYPALANDAVKLDFIHDCLTRIAREESLSRQDYDGRMPIPVISFLPGLSTNDLRPSTSSLQRVIRYTQEKLQELVSGVAPHTHQRVPQAPSFFSPAIEPGPIQPLPKPTSQERYDALKSNEALEALGYRQAAFKDEWICSFTQDIADDPVSSGSSYKGVYERAFITRWILQSSHNKPTISALDPNTREQITLEQIVSLPDVKEQINQFLSEQEAIKKYFEQCLERGFSSQNESMAVVPYRP